MIDLIASYIMIIFQLQKRSAIMWFIVPDIILIDRSGRVCCNAFEKKLNSLIFPTLEVTMQL